MLKTKELIASYRIWKIITKGQLPPENAAEACADQQPKHRQEWLKVKNKIIAGDRLSEAMETAGLWPEDALHAVRAGEASRQLPTVFDQLMDMTDEADKISRMAKKKLIAPFAYISVGQGLFFAFFIKLYPALTATAEKRDGIIRTMDGIRDVVEAMAMPMLALFFMIILSPFIISRIESLHHNVMVIFEKIPGWGDGQRMLAVANWAKIFSLLDKTGSIHDEESIKIATSILDKRYQEPFKMLSADYLKKGSLAEASNKDKWSRADPRHQWPNIFSSALAAGALAGGTGQVLGDVADGLMEEGKLAVEGALDKLNMVGMGVAGLSIGAVMLLMALSSLAQTMATL